SLGNVALSLMRCDVPEVSSRIFHTSRALAIFLVAQLVNQSRSRRQRFLAHRIRAFHVDVQCVGIRSRSELAPRNASADHQHGITNPHLAVQTSRRSHRAESLL